jgi:hypothetical protein
LLSDANFILTEEIDPKLKDEFSWTIDELSTFSAKQTVDLAHLNFVSKKDLIGRFSTNELNDFSWLHALSRAILWTPSFSIPLNIGYIGYNGYKNNCSQKI